MGCLQRYAILIVVTILTLVMSELTGVTEDASVPCPCDVEGNTLDCSITELFNIPSNCSSSNITTLVLTGHSIAYIPDSAFVNFTDLTILRLNNNNISTIAPNAFQGLSKLQELYLQDNLLYIPRMDQGIFTPLSNLEILDISNNIFFLPPYPGIHLSPLTNLRNLTIYGINNSLVTFNQGFAALKSLETLVIRAKLEVVTNLTFSVFSNMSIKTVKIWSGFLSQVQPHAFAHFKFLETLDLSFNPNLGLVGASMAWPGLKYTQIKSLILERSAPFDTTLVTLESSFFCGLEHTNITTLDLSGNHILNAHGLFAEYLPNLRKLYVSRNRLTQVNSIIQDIGQMENLVIADFRYQAKRTFISEVEILAGVIPETRLTRGLDSDIDLLHIQDSLSIKSDSGEACSNVSGDKPYPLYHFATGWNITIPPTLEYLYLTGSLTLELEQFPPTILYNSINLRHIAYGANGIQNFNNEIIMVHKTNHPLTVDISDNGCGSIDGMFANEIFATSISELLMNRNELASFLNNDIGRKFLRNVTGLTRIDLGDNGLKELPKDIFMNNNLLHNISFAKNALRNFRIDLSHLSALKQLDLSQNLISTLDTDTINVLTKIAASNKEKNESYQLEVNLEENPIVCSCDTQDFLKWVQNEHAEDTINFKNFDRYYCFYQSRERLWEGRELSKVINDLDWFCKRTLVIILVTVMSAVAILIIALTICCCRHKWDVRFWIINIIIKRKEDRSKQMDSNRTFMYDAFVAYHNDALSWIKHQMIPKLEGHQEEPLNLCLHHRDFPLGKVIEENIVESIKNSRKTILLINKEFLKSSWCYFEMQMARSSSFDEGRDVIIAVLLEPISPSTEGVSQTLMNILRKRTYIVWPEEKYLQEHFWDRLHRAVLSSNQRPTRCECGKAMAHDGQVYYLNSAMNRLPRIDADSLAGSEVLY